MSEHLFYKDCMIYVRLYSLGQRALRSYSSAKLIILCEVLDVCDFYSLQVKIMNADHWNIYVPVDTSNEYFPIYQVI